MFGRFRHRLTIAIGVIILVEVTAGIFGIPPFGLFGDTEKAATQTTAVARKGPLARMLSLNADLSPARSADLYFPANTKVTSLLVKPGELVQQGQKLGTVDARPMKSELAKAETELRLAQQKLTRAKRSQRAVADAVDWVAQAAKKVTQAHKNLAETVMYAPFSGQVTELNGSVGQHITDLDDESNPSAAGQPFLTVADLSFYQLEVNLPEAEIAQIKIGQSVTVRVPSLPDRQFSATVTQLSSVPNDFGQADKRFFVHIRPAEPLTRVPASQLVTVNITVAELPNVLQIPVHAVHVVNGVTTAMVVENAAIKQQPVLVGLQGEHTVHITAGLREGDQVLLADLGGPGRFPESGFPHSPSTTVHSGR